MAEPRLTETLASVASLQFLHPHPQSPSGFAAAWLTGFCVEAGSARYVVSAAHFAGGSHSFVARFFGLGLTSRLTLALRQFNEARREDVAVFSIEDPSVHTRLAAAVVVSDEHFCVGDDAYIAGYPYPDLLKAYYKVPEPVQVIKKGVVSAKLGRTADCSPVLLLDAIWDQGMSGGPVIHGATGRVIGVVTSRPVMESQPLEFITCPSGDQVLELLSRVAGAGA